jgi:hypothetical protein
MFQIGRAEGVHGGLRHGDLVVVRVELREHAHESEGGVEHPAAARLGVGDPGDRVADQARMVDEARDVADGIRVRGGRPVVRALTERLLRVDDEEGGGGGTVHAFILAPIGAGRQGTGGHDAHVLRHLENRQKKSSDECVTNPDPRASYL